MFLTYKKYAEQGRFELLTYLKSKYDFARSPNSKQKYKIKIKKYFLYVSFYVEFS